ncbi:MAG: cytidine deaminase [Brachyspira sp.]|nr:cytidine deaminase [Brachyspira sp.]
MDYNELLNRAKDASEHAYAPYSKFKVGACVLTGNGKIYTGCNFENSSFGLTICAERNAIGSAICDGENKIKAVAIYSPNTKHCYPCGACRQVINEFVSEEGVDIILEGEDSLEIVEFEDVFPKGFYL